MIIPFGLLFICMGILALNFVTTGEIIERELALKAVPLLSMVNDTSIVPRISWRQNAILGEQSGTDITIDALKHHLNF